jgi:hypothetical protein
MIRLMIYIATVFIAVILIGQSVLAQGNNGQQGQLRRELERTDELIVRAREAVSASDDALAAQALERAVTFQKTAYTALEQTQYVLALTWTKKAREQASAAISNSRMAGQLDGVVNVRLERARDLLDRVREAIDGPLTPGMTIAFEQARNSLAQAWEFYRRGQMRAAAKLVEQVEQSVQRLQNMAREYNQSAQEFDFRYDNVLQSLEQAKLMLVECQSPVARDQLDQAEQMLQLARQMRGEDHPEAAIASVNRAHEAVRRANRECQGSDRLEERLQQLEAEAERLQTRLEGAGAGSVEAPLGLLTQAREQLKLARKYLGEEKNDQAMVALQAANLAMRQAGRYLSETN